MPTRRADWWAAADGLADPASAQELVETFLHLTQIDAADYGNMHDVEDTRGEALSILDEIEAATGQHGKSDRFSR